jgi:hypothetical protein
MNDLTMIRSLANYDTHIIIVTIIILYMTSRFMTRKISANYPSYFESTPAEILLRVS